MTDEWTLQWLDRIGIRSVPEPSVEALSQIVRQHLRSIPFENLTVLNGEIPALDPDALLDKMVTGKRGGYCFELNGLLAKGLANLGFDVQPALARVLWQKPAPGPRTHLFLKVKLEGTTWLVDAGFGGPCPDVPVALAGETGQAVHHPYDLADEPGLGTVLSRSLGDGQRANLYCFHDEFVGKSDIDAANWLAATYPNSIFRHRVMAALGDRADRRTLDGPRFSHVSGEMRHTDRNLGTAADVCDCLENEFGLALSAQDKQALGRLTCDTTDGSR